MNDEPMNFDRRFSEERPVEAAPAKAVVESVETARPVIALMGEFSAGKSTLSNLLIGKSALPVNITATQLPPVWISYGSDEPYRVGVDGSKETFAMEELEMVSVDDTNHIHLYAEAELLKKCDIIDMPGISDPNMSSQVWERVIPHADAVIWCSHATQAWRQSEAAVWQMMPKELYTTSLLLLTRMDKILSDRDRQRLVRRVEKETSGLFRSVCPISLLKALEAGENNFDAWQESGADLFMSELIAVIEGGGAAPSEATVRKRVESRPISAAITAEAADIPPEEAPSPAKMVMPTRVKPRPLSTSNSLRSRLGGARS